MKANIIAIFLLVVAAALGAIYWKVDQDFFSEKLAWNEAQSRTELSALTHSVQAELDAFSQVLDLTVPSFKDSKKDYSRDQVYSHFQMIAVLNEPSNAQETDVHLDKTFFLQGSEVKPWAVAVVNTALKAPLFKNHLASDPQNILLTVLDPKRRAWVLFVCHSKLSSKRFAALLSADALQGIIDRQKGQMATLAILNQEAQVLGHTTSEYIGSWLKEDPLAKDFTKSGNGSGSGLFNAQGERIHGFYEQVDGSNLYVTVSTPLRILLADRSKIKTRFVFMSIGITLLGVASLMLLNGDSALATTAKSFRTNKFLRLPMVSAMNAIGTLARRPKDSSVPIAATEDVVAPKEEPEAEAKVENRISAKPPMVANAVRLSSGTESKAKIRSAPAAPLGGPVDRSIPPARDVPVAKNAPPPAPVAPPPLHPANEKFSQLFNDKKMQEAFSAIDQLDQLDSPLPASTPAPRPPPAGIQANVPLPIPLPIPLPATEKTETPPAPLTAVEAVIFPEPKMPPPVGQALVSNIKIRRQKKTSRLDDLEVPVRRAGQMPVPPSKVSKIGEGGSTT